MSEIGETEIQNKNEISKIVGDFFHLSHNRGVMGGMRTNSHSFPCLLSIFWPSHIDKNSTIYPQYLFLVRIYIFGMAFV